MEPSIRKHNEPLPPTMDEVMAYLRRVIVLPKVQKVVITPNEISVMREVDEGEAVVPPELRAEKHIDVRDIIDNLKYDLIQIHYDPEKHPYMVLEEAMRALTRGELYPTHIVAAEGEWLSAWLGLDFKPEGGDKVLGMKVVYSNSDLLDRKILVLGSPISAGLLVDTSHAVVMDI